MRPFLTQQVHSVTSYYMSAFTANFKFHELYKTYFTNLYRVSFLWQSWQFKRLGVFLGHPVCIWNISWLKEWCQLLLMHDEFRSNIQIIIFTHVLTYDLPCGTRRLEMADPFILYQVASATLVKKVEQVRTQFLKCESLIYKNIQFQNCFNLIQEVSFISRTATFWIGWYGELLVSLHNILKQNSRIRV